MKKQAVLSVLVFGLLLSLAGASAHAQDDAPAYKFRVCSAATLIWLMTGEMVVWQLATAAQRMDSTATPAPRPITLGSTSASKQISPDTMAPRRFSLSRLHLLGTAPRILSGRTSIPTRSGQRSCCPSETSRSSGISWLAARMLTKALPVISASTSRGLLPGRVRSEAASLPAQVAMVLRLRRAEAWIGIMGAGASGYSKWIMFTLLSRLVNPVIAQPAV